MQINQLNENINVTQRANAKRLTLRVCQHSGKILVTTPPRSSPSSIENFVLKNLTWVRDQKRKITAKTRVSEGSLLLVHGVKRKLCINLEQRIGYVLQENKVLLNCKTEQVGNKAKTFLISHAKDFLEPIIQGHANLLKKKVNKISFKDTKSRWGSCSSNGSLMINWRLIMAPDSVSRYVAIHEVCHLVHMNHGADFWKLVETFHPMYLLDRKWLKSYGNLLKSYTF